MFQLPSEYVFSIVKNMDRKSGEAPLPDFFLDEWAWQKCIDYANSSQCLSPFLKRIHQASWFVSIPEGIRLLIEEKQARERVRIAVLDRELDNALYGLLGSGVAPLALGGVDWSRRFYADRMDRPFQKIELMVRDQDWLTAMHSLGRLGFRVVFQDAEAADFGSIKLYRSFNDPSIWSRSISGELKGLPDTCLALSLEDAWVFALRNSLNWGTISPIFLFDFALFMRQENLGKFKVDWKNILTLCQKHHLVSVCWSILEFLRVCWDEPISVSVRGIFGDQVGPARKLWLSAQMAEKKWLAEDRKAKDLMRPDGSWETFRAAIHL